MNAMQIDIRSESPSSPDARILLEELSMHLLTKTGRDGRNSFALVEMDQPGSRFLMAYSSGIPMGCGGLRRLHDAADEGVCEVKRMYARNRGQGVAQCAVGSGESSDDS